MIRNLRALGAKVLNYPVQYKITTAFENVIFYWMLDKLPASQLIIEKGKKARKKERKLCNKSKLPAEE